MMSNLRSHLSFLLLGALALIILPYFITSRFWELLAGSLIVFFEIKYKAKHINQDLNKGQILSVLGILMIVCPIYFYDSNIYHPSIFTFIPVLLSQ